MVGGVVGGREGYLGGGPYRDCGRNFDITDLSRGIDVQKICHKKFQIS